MRPVDNRQQRAWLCASQPKTVVSRLFACRNRPSDGPSHENKCPGDTRGTRAKGSGALTIAPREELGEARTDRDGRYSCRLRRAHARSSRGEDAPSGAPTRRPPRPPNCSQRRRATCTANGSESGSHGSPTISGISTRERSKLGYLANNSCSPTTPSCRGCTLCCHSAARGRTNWPDAWPRASPAPPIGQTDESFLELKFRAYRFRARDFAGAGGQHVRRAQWGVRT